MEGNPKQMEMCVVVNSRGRSTEGKESKAEEKEAERERERQRDRERERERERKDKSVAEWTKREGEKTANRRAIAVLSKRRPCAWGTCRPQLKRDGGKRPEVSGGQRDNRRGGAPSAGRELGSLRSCRRGGCLSRWWTIHCCRRGRRCGRARRTLRRGKPLDLLLHDRT